MPNDIWWNTSFGVNKKSELPKLTNFQSYKNELFEELIYSDIGKLSTLQYKKLLLILTWKNSTYRDNFYNQLFENEFHDIYGFNFVQDCVLDSVDSYFFDCEEQRLFNKLTKDNKIKIWQNTYLAPETLNKLFYNSKRDIEFTNIQLKIWNGSNIQEIRETICNFNRLPVSIEIWDNSSLAHWVRFIVTKPSKSVDFVIWDNVFVWIKTILENGVIIKSWDHNMYTSIWFGCKIEKWVIIWHRVIIWDGSVIKQWVEIPDDVAVIAGSCIDENTVNNIISMNEYENKSYEEKELFSGLVKLNDWWKDRNKMDILDWVYKFLEWFNYKVLRENHFFPTLYRLIKKYHSDQYESVQFDKWRAININLPVNLKNFIMHYFIESVKIRIDSNYKVLPFVWEFTKVLVTDTIITGLLYNIWQAEISWSFVYWTVVNRSGDEWWNLVLKDSIVHNGVVFHAKWEKNIFNSEIHDKTTIHWKVNLQFSQVFDECLIHDSQITSDWENRKNRTNIWSRSTIVWAMINNSQFANDVHIMWHSWQVIIKDSYVWEKTHISSASKINKSIIEWDINLWRGFNIDNSSI